MTWNTKALDQQFSDSCDPSLILFPPRWQSQLQALTFPHTTMFKCSKREFRFMVLSVKEKKTPCYISLTWVGSHAHSTWMFWPPKQEAGLACTKPPLKSALISALPTGHSEASSWKKSQNNLWAFNPSRQQLKMFSPINRFFSQILIGIGLCLQIALGQPRNTMGKLKQ